MRKIPIKNTVKTASLEEIYKSGLRILSPQSNEELFPLIVFELNNLVGCDFISIYRENHNELNKIYTSFSRLEEVRPRKNGFTYKTFKKNKPYLLNNREIIARHPELKGIGIINTLFIPLEFEKNVIGVLSLDFLHNVSFSSQDLKLLTLLSNQIAYKLFSLESYSKLKEVVENQNLFMSLASHELKNPLTALKGYASLIDRIVEKGKTLNPKISKMLVTEVNRMGDIINEFLNTNAMSLKKILKYNKKNYWLQNIIHHTVINFQFAHPTRTIVTKYEIKKDCMLSVDYQKIIQLLSNLLNNAVKFSSVSSEVVLQIEETRSAAIIKVIDHGVGIDKKDLPRIFEEFYRSNKNNKEGMGLGLFLCKQIVEEHNGKIKIQSKLNEGTTFEVHLPKSG